MPPGPQTIPYPSGRILGIGVRRIQRTATGFDQIAQSLMGAHPMTAGVPRVSGVARIWWRIASVITAPATSSTPRVRIGWQAHDEATRGNLLNILTPTPAGTFDPASASQPPSLVCDAWYGSIEVQGTAFSVAAGFGPDDTASGDFVVEATITEGGTGAEQFATFARYITIPVGPAPVLTRIPGATATINNGAARVRTVAWYNSVAQDISLTISDFAGTAIQLIRTGAVAAPAPYGPQEWPLAPSAETISVSAGGAAVTNALLVFRYY